MNYMKTVLNFIGFLLLFTLIFAVLQPILIHKDDSGISFRQFYNEPADSLDVLIVGSSNIRTSVLPAVLWEDAGIASYNLSSNGMNAPAQYYLLKDALRFQSPEVVIIEGAYLFKEVNFDTNSDEGRFRQTLDNMPWSRVKLESVMDIISNSDEQTFISYVFPLLRYHNRHSFDERDFDRSYKKQRNLNMGAWESVDTLVQEQSEVYPYYETGFISETYDDYLVRIIDLCKEQDIAVILLDTPTCNEQSLTLEQRITMQEFADEHRVTYINLNDSELFWHTGLNFSTDFYDIDHINISGGRKVSAYLAHYLSDTFCPVDRRNTSYDPHWDDVVDFHYSRYEELLDGIDNNGW